MGTPSQLPDPARSAFSARALLTGSLLSLCLACAAPYGNMVIRGSYMALDFSTPGAIFLFFLLVGPLNGLARAVRTAWALTRSELLVVYAMMITASAIPTMGLSEYLLTITTAAQYFATPENEWASLINGHVPSWMVPQSATAIRWFYEGKPQGASIPWQPWVEPLCYWVLFAMSLYLVMIALMVVLRRQWAERERLLFPIVQVPLEMVRQDAEGRSTFWRSPILWVGFALPAIVSSLNGLHAYYNTVPAVQLVSTIPILRDATSIIVRLSFPMVGFSYLINLDIALSLWLFNLLAKIAHGTMGMLGVASSEQLGIYGAASKPILAHYGQGAFLVLVFFGLWLARNHLRAVWRRAVRGDESVDDSGEIMSYRAALACLLGGCASMVGWLIAAGMPPWVAIALLALALAIFVGLTRVVVESGVAAATSPLIAASTLVSAVGSSALGTAGMVGLAYTHVWGADIRTFVMASCMHSLKLSESMGRNVRPLLWALLLAIVLSMAGSIATILYLAYEYGGINLNGWFFGAGARTPFDYVAAKLATPTEAHIEGWIHTIFGGALMVGLMTVRHHLLWWPLHPIGFPVSMIWLMDQLWFSIFLAWLFKALIVKYGGPKLFLRARPFFFGLIIGQFASAGLWLVIDFFTGMTDNVVFWI